MEDIKIQENQIDPYVIIEKIKTRILVEERRVGLILNKTAVIFTDDFKIKTAATDGKKIFISKQFYREFVLAVSIEEAEERLQYLVIHEGIHKLLQFRLENINFVSRMKHDRILEEIYKMACEIEVELYIIKHLPFVKTYGIAVQNNWLRDPLPDSFELYRILIKDINRSRENSGR